ncbi:MAG TPA: amidase [Thermoleophilaceae bacterium]|nr:amidase [Thermoleophilaceae bacterium]
MAEPGMWLTAAEQADAVRSGRVEARELVARSLAAIERTNPELNAFVAVCAERALREAEAIAARDARLLCGVPIAVKDLFAATEGIPTTNGSNACTGIAPDHDSTHIRRLRDAGAVVVGKTNTPELGLRPVTENHRYGATRNPWDASLSPGGSSGGSAAAVAAGIVALADGSDLGGSLRIPASCCGVVALKPSVGRVPSGPDTADLTAGVMSYGVLTRTVADTALALDAMAGPETGARRLAHPAPPSFAEAARREPGRLRVRVALDAPLGIPVDPEPSRAAERVAVALSDAGHLVAEGKPDWDHEDFAPSWSTFTTATMQHLVRSLVRSGNADPDGFEPATKAWLVETPPVSAADYLDAAEALWAYARRLVTGWRDDEVLVTPTLTRLPASLGTFAEAGVSDDGVRFSALVRIWNVTGQPAISLPLHETREGVPVGVQIVGPPGRDDLVLSVGTWLEGQLGRHPSAAAG